MGPAVLTGCEKRDTVEPTVGIDSPQHTWVRVLLFGNLEECVVSAPNGFTVEGIDNGVMADFSDTGDLSVHMLNGRIGIGDHVICREMVLRPKDPHYFVINGIGFRGHLHLRVQDGSLQAVNHVPLESYLLGVVGAEMYSYWEPEALKAQAVAARTYCLAIRHRFGPGRWWDLTRTQANQMYNGLAAENPRIRQAVLDTTGQVLIGPSKTGKELIFPAYYSSSCGGHTENSRDVFGDDLVVLPGVACPWCEVTARRGDFFWGPVHYSMAAVSSRLMDRYASLQRLGRIAAVEVIGYGALGRITQVQLIGPDGRTDHVRGEDFRLALDPSGRRLRSTLVTITDTNGGIQFDHGRGFGHGVGLCQYGVQGLAHEGRHYADILSYYYPEARLVTIQGTASP